MGWEVWHDEGDSYGRIGFFCNTADVSFGPVIYTGTGFDKSQFYQLWDKANLPDARSMDEGELSSKSRHLVRLSNWEDVLIVTMNVYRTDGTNAPVKIFDHVSKECFENATQSAFHKVLEVQFDDDTEEGEAQWDFVCEAVEEMNDEMAIMVIREDEQQQISHEYKGVIVEYVWEVLDE